MVLVIESESALRILITANLRARGVAASAIPDIREAFDAIAECQPHTIMLDVTYDDEAVWDFLTTLAEKHGRIRVVVMTTLPDNVKRSTRYSNVQTAMLKPFDVDRLMDVVSQLPAL